MVRPRLSGCRVLLPARPRNSRHSSSLKEKVWPTWSSRHNWVRLRNKSERIAKLAVALAPITGANPEDAEKAALLAKCDLTSELSR